MTQKRRWPSCTPSPTAYHEAGHAVVALRLGVPILYATIVPDVAKGNGGAVHRVDAPCKTGDTHAWHRRNVVIAFAGPAAQRRSHPRSPVWHMAKFDRESWSIVAECLFNTFHRQKSFLRDAAAEASRIVEESWLAVDHVARALMERRNLSGAAVADIVAQAEAEWCQVSGYRPGETVFAYARACAIAAQGLPPLRRAHVAAATLRATLAGAADVEAAVLADLTGRGYEAAAVRSEWDCAKEAHTA